MSRERPHHVTVRVRWGTWNLRSQRCFAKVRDALEVAKRRDGFRVIHYSVQGNHVHLIVVPSDEDGLRRTFADAHRRYTGFINARHRWTGHLWQGRYGAVVMDELHLAHAMRYVSLNPVRAGLVERVREYPYWDAVWAQRRVAVPAEGCAVAACAAPTGASDVPGLPVGATQVATATTELRRNDPLAETLHAGALRNNTIPPTINLENPDPACDLDYTPNTARERAINAAMSNSFGFGGHNASILIGRLRNGKA